MEADASLLKEGVETYRTAASEALEAARGWEEVLAIVERPTYLDDASNVRDLPDILKMAEHSHAIARRRAGPEPWRLVEMYAKLHEQRYPREVESFRAEMERSRAASAELFRVMERVLPAIEDRYDVVQADAAFDEGEFEEQHVVRQRLGFE